MGPQADGAYLVATHQRVAPAGASITFYGRPTDLALDPAERLLAIHNSNGIVFVDVARRQVAQQLVLPQDPSLDADLGGSSAGGIVWTRNGDTVWTSDAFGALHAAARQQDGSLRWSQRIELPGPAAGEPSGPIGLAVEPAAPLLYVALSRNNSMGLVDLRTGKLAGEIAVGVAPYAVVVQGGRAFVSNWGGRRPRAGDPTGPTSGSRAVVDARTGIAASGTVSVVDLAARRTIKEIDVGLHPSGMAVSPDGARLFVANANSDTVSIIDLQTLETAGTLSARPRPGMALGSSPQAVAVAPDGKTLFVAEAGNNLLALLDATTGAVKELIPCGWYPGAVALGKGGTELYVANVKGLGSRMRDLDPGYHPQRQHGGFNAFDHLGSISIVPLGDPAALRRYTAQAAADLTAAPDGFGARAGPVEEGAQMSEPAKRASFEHPPQTGLARAPKPSAAAVRDAPRIVPVRAGPGQTSSLEHVLYIIKENKTYDQVLGDLPRGNGDPRLCMFPRQITPNHHALAEEFVLLDNFYCNGVLSADGHQWTDEGVATDYIEKSMAGFTRSYPSDGTDALAYAASGFIWDQVRRKGLSFRDYGEFIKSGLDLVPAAATWTDVYQDFLRGTSRVQLRQHTELDPLRPYLSVAYPGFSTRVPDVLRAARFLSDLKGFEAAGRMPSFMIMLLGNDHTTGTDPGFPTPNAALADNDLALGRIVEAVSASSFWPKTVIFVVEDDAQDGLDHVDGHRTVAFCISPYTRRGAVDSAFYNQSSMLRTIEDILGLEPMTQFDRAAKSMLGCFGEHADLTPYQARPNQVPLDDLNPSLAALTGKALDFARQSLAMSFLAPDLASPYLLNRILWHAVKGYDVPYPRALPEPWLRRWQRDRPRRAPLDRRLQGPAP